MHVLVSLPSSGIPAAFGCTRLWIREVLDLPGAEKICMSEFVVPPLFARAPEVPSACLQTPPPFLAPLAHHE